MTQHVFTDVANLPMVTLNTLVSESEGAVHREESGVACVPYRTREGGRKAMPTDPITFTRTADSIRNAGPTAPVGC